jgi:anti-sigma factor RsiW
MIRGYLLGELSPEDGAQVEERLLLEDDVYQELLIVEDELIDEYLARNLSDSEKESFERHFLSTPERREKVRFGHHMKKYVSRAGPLSAEATTLKPPFSDKLEVANPPQKKPPLFSFLPWGNPIVSYSFAAAVVLIVAVASILLVRNLTQTPRSGAGNILAVELVSGLTRGDDEIKSISIPRDTDTVRLELRIASATQYASYRAVLHTRQGLERFAAGDLKATIDGQREVVPFQLAATLLSPGDYSVKLSGLNQTGKYDDLGRYSFRVAQN